MESHEAALSRLQSRQYAIKGEIAALEIPPLKAEMEANNEKIAHLEERKRYYETDLKIREAQKKELLRKQRNRRIFTRGGMLESFLQEPLIMTNEEVHDFLLEVFRMPEVEALNMVLSMTDMEDNIFIFLQLFIKKRVIRIKQLTVSDENRHVFQIRQATIDQRNERIVIVRDAGVAHGTHNAPSDAGSR